MSLDQIKARAGDGPLAILLHSNADMDCVGAAAAIALHRGSCILSAPGGVSHLGKNLLSFIGLEAADTMDLPDGRPIIVVDARDDSSLGYRGTPWDRAIVIDHHDSDTESPASLAYVDRSAASCCDIIWDFLGRPKSLNRRIGLCLLAGMLADTGHLKRGGHETLRAASEIMESSGLNMEDMLFLFESAQDQDISRRVSRMKGVQRMMFERTGEWIVACSEIGSFEGAVCGAMLSLGADVAFAGVRKGEGFRITGRANALAVNAGIHLGKMLGRIAEECGGEGGGHDGAAGFTGTGDAEAMLRICTQGALAALKGRKRNNSSKESVL